MSVGPLDVPVKSRLRIIACMVKLVQNLYVKESHNYHINFKYFFRFFLQFSLSCTDNCKDLSSI